MSQGPFLRPCGTIGRDTYHSPKRILDNRATTSKLKKAIGANAKSGPNGFFNGLLARFAGIRPLPQGHKKGPWGSMRRVPSRAFTGRLAGILPAKPPHQEDSREFGHNAVEKSLAANAKSGPKGLFYGLVARLAGILPDQEDSREFGQKAVEKGFGGQCEKGPQALFLRSCGPIGWDTSHQAFPPRVLKRIWPQGRREGPWGQCEKRPQGPFLRLCGPIRRETFPPDPIKVIIENLATRP